MFKSNSAKHLAEKSIKKEKNISERALKQKLEQMLSRKGFTRDVYCHGTRGCKD